MQWGVRQGRNVILRISTDWALTLLRRRFDITPKSCCVCFGLCLGVPKNMCRNISNNIMLILYTNVTYISGESGTWYEQQNTKHGNKHERIEEERRESLVFSRPC